MKKWFDVTVTRVIVNGKGENMRRNVQHAVVWGTEENAVGIGFRRCPDPFEGEDRRYITYAEVSELPDNFDLQGRKMKAVNEEIEDGAQYGLDPEDLEKMTQYPDEDVQVVAQA